MYRTKRDVDKHVETLISKLSVKEFKTRAYSVARLYFEVGDFASCQRYVEEYLTHRDNNAAAHKLLAQALHKSGQKEKALEHYKTTLDIDPTQTSTILDICELLADDEVAIDPARAKYWCEKAEATFPRHRVTFLLRERLVTISNPDPEALVNFITAELAVRPKDASLHARLLKHYLHTNQTKKAFDHSCNVEFGGNRFPNNYSWYDTLAEILKHNLGNISDWLYQLLFLTVRERICVLSLTETPSGSSKSLIESNDLLHAYDQAIEKVAKAGAPPGFGEFHVSLLQHHRGQFALHAATFLLKKAKKDQLSWRDATRFAAPLMLIAWQTVPLDSKVNWLTHAPEKQQIAVQRWYTEGAYRCSQSGHYLLSNIQDKSQSFLDRISQCCSGTHWRDKLYEKLFTNRDHLAKITSSHFVSNAYGNPVLRLPRKIEVEAYDGDAQREYANSLHHFVWILSNYKNYAHFKCTLFDMLTPTATNCGPETLNKLDVHAFAYSASLTTRQQKANEVTHASPDKPTILPANITDLLCPVSQMKWWDCAYKFCQNELGTELTDIRATLSRGIEVVRCIDNHGMDPELLCMLGNIFSEQAKLTTVVEEKNNLEIRAGLYYSSAIPLLEKLKSKMTIKIPEKRMFDYTHRELGTKELNSLIEESKLYVAVNYLNDGEYEKAIELLSNLKSPQACYHLSQIYKKVAFEGKNYLSDNAETKSKYALLTKAKSFAYKALDRMRDTEVNKNNLLYSNVQQLIEELETNINKIEPDLSGSVMNDVDGKYSSDENLSSVSEHVPMRNNHHAIRNLSSTPKHQLHSNISNYRTAADSQILETTRSDQQFLQRIENQIKNFQHRFTDDFMEQTKSWFDENRKLGNQIMSTIQTDIQNTNDQFKLLKISVDQVKDQIDECRSECKDVGDLKKQVAELKKEVNKLKKASSEQTIDESDLYNLDDDYRTNESTSTFAAQLPFQAPQVMPQFNQRLVPPFPIPPNPYQLYSQNLYNLYNQYSQFAQSPSVPGAPTLFDPTRTPVNYPGVYPTPDQMYLDVAQLVPPTVPPPPTIPTVHSVATVPTVPILPSVPTIPAVAVPPPATSVAAAKQTSALEAKETLRSLPVNVVITSSDPLPTCTTTPAPILSVTIPPKHIKGTPHNYQIPMPSASSTKEISPPVFSFPVSWSKTSSVTTASSSFWPQPNTFKNTQTSMGATTESYFSSPRISDNLDNSKSVVDGAFIGSPNTSFNKSRSLSERSNISIENYDPCPDFKPIIPLPAEVKVTTGEEGETVVFSARAKLFRFVDKQWKERGIGEMKLLKHKVTGKVRVLMRREQIHKICANHIITPEMEIKSMKNETKAYFWVANDFADEAVVLEKFCIRFKTADIAQQFYETFEMARLESDISTASTPKSDVITKLNTPKSVPDQLTPIRNTSASQHIKTEFGGFTFSSTPTFKPMADRTLAESKPEPVTSKVNVFSGLAFKTTNSSPLSNIFTSTATFNQINSSSPVQNQEVAKKLNSSDVVEEFEPNMEFKPVVPLPALVDQKTGEENETILFEHRAKLLRFDAASKEWKERGLGNIKLLVHNENDQKLRLLMRREQIMKICCNHAVTKEMTFQKMPNVDKAVTWCAKDYSEGELVAETFCLRFKTVQACNDFIEAIKTAQSKMKNDTELAKDKQNASNHNEQIGFGDKFKPKSGSWHCDGCYTNNLESFAKCACCETPRPQANTNKASNTTTTPNWGDKFRPKPGSWECNACLIRNESNADYCGACNSPKDPTMAKKENKIVQDNPPKFSFGIPQNKSDQKKEVLATSTGNMPGWGDMFQPKEGTWECQQCFVRNQINVETCAACSSPKNPNTNTKEAQSTFINVTSGPKFNFGIPLTSNDAPKPKTETTSIFDGTGAHKFSFGIPSNAQDKSSIISFGEQKPSMFGTPKVSGNDGPVNLSSKLNDDKSNQPTTPKPPLLPTPQADASQMVGKEGGTFEFVFKPKTPSKGKSPAKSPKSPKCSESDGNEYASEDEGHHIHFSPVVPMPDKVDVVTGEENETELYGHRAKLFRFTSGEWKERGIGVVKVLKHKHTGKLRVVMRREQVLKICLNHALTADVAYTAKDDKTWLFAANDFSEGELSLQQFCLRFKTKEIALEFKVAVDMAREGKIVAKKDTGSGKKGSDIDEVVFVNEIQATAEEKQKAKELMLPENFFTYKNKEPCRGCRGCKDDDDEVAKPAKIVTTLKALPTFADTLSTPVKTSIAAFHSPMNSIYGTPANFDRTVDTSIFRTPLGSTDSASPFTPNNSFSEKHNKENTFTQKNIFTGFEQQTNIFEYPYSAQRISAPENRFGAAGDARTSSKSSILAAPKLANLNTSGGEQPPESKSIFSTTETKPVIEESKSIFGNTNSGVSANSSIFGLSTDRKIDCPKSEVKSIFGVEDKPVNLFSSATQGSIFGPGALAKNQQKPETGGFGTTALASFGTNAPTQTFASGTNIFGAAANQAPATWAFATQNKPDVTVTNVDDEKSDAVKTDNEQTSTSEPLFNVDNKLSFAALSSGGPGFNIQQKTPDFQWEGAGQQLFKAGQKGSGAAGDDKCKNESGAGDDAVTAGGDEEYDPHYEPIVPLPDKIVVTTGEEDEEKMFGERCKLYRYDDRTREWKERGVGEMKVLYHPERKTYRLLLRREQVHKAVLNMLLFMDLDLLPMKNSDRAWTWAGRNYAERAAGEQETLAVRFKSVDLAAAFHDKVVECVRKLQVAAAEAIKEEKESALANVAPLRLPKHFQEGARIDCAMGAAALEQVQSPSQSQETMDKQKLQVAAAEAIKEKESALANVALLRLPKHLQEGARIDCAMGAAALEQVQSPSQSQETMDKQNGEVSAPSAADVLKQVHFQVPEEGGEDEEDYEHDYEDYDPYYNDDEEESATYYSCDGEAIVRQGDAQTTCERAHVQVLFDQEIYSPKILVTDSDTGEILADMLIHTDTEFQMSGETCSWSGTDYTSNDPVDKTVTVNFWDSETALQFYDSCETSKAATYTSTDPES